MTHPRILLALVTAAVTLPCVTARAALTRQLALTEHGLVRRNTGIPVSRLRRGTSAVGLSMVRDVRLLAKLQLGARAGSVEVQMIPAVYPTGNIFVVKGIDRAGKPFTGLTAGRYTPELSGQRHRIISPIELVETAPAESEYSVWPLPDTRLTAWKQRPVFDLTPLIAAEVFPGPAAKPVAGAQARSAPGVAGAPGSSGGGATIISSAPIVLPIQPGDTARVFYGTNGPADQRVLRRLGSSFSLGQSFIASVNRSLRPGLRLRRW
jgi:hypothetical protein